MASFATPADLASWIQSDVDTATATLLLASSSAAIRAYCGWNITEEVVTGDVIDGSGDWDIWLPTRNLTAVASVSNDGVALTVGTQYEWFRTGRLTRLAALWTRKAKGVLATYTHGYPTGHPKLDLAKAVCLTASARQMTNPAGLRSETVGGASWTMAGEGPEATSALTEGEQYSLYPLALHGVG